MNKGQPTTAILQADQPVSIDTPTPDAPAMGDAQTADLAQLGDLQIGDVSITANGGLNNAMVIAAGTSQTNDLAQQADKDLLEYRDYLLDLFILTDEEKDPDYLELIESRFFQNFRTTSRDLLPVDRLMIPIVSKIMETPSDAFGLGVDLLSWPSSENKTEREYLEALLALAGVSAHEFGVRYGLDLERPAGALSCEVAENIGTLQRFYRDSFQDLKDHKPIYPADKQDRAPFFLQYDEWQRYTAPFYGENFYNGKLPLFQDLLPYDRQQILDGADITTFALWKWYQQALGCQRQNG